MVGSVRLFMKHIVRESDMEVGAAEGLSDEDKQFLIRLNCVPSESRNYFTYIYLSYKAYKNSVKLLQDEDSTRL